MPNNEYTRFPVCHSQVSFGTGATVHADAAEEEEEEAEEVRAASLQHLRMQTLATLSKSLFFFSKFCSGVQQQSFLGFHRTFRCELI